jgi:hypothetical protein
MKKDTKHKAEVRKPPPAAVLVGDPRPAQQPAPPGATVSVNWSARYIDSRLKQFYCR